MYKHIYIYAFSGLLRTVARQTDSLSFLKNLINKKIVLTDGPPFLPDMLNFVAMASFNFLFNININIKTTLSGLLHGNLFLKLQTYGIKQQYIIIIFLIVH